MKNEVSNGSSIPVNYEDRAAIEAFLAKNSGQPVVAVQGLGFVGAVMALVCANAIGNKYAVLGVDLLRPATYSRVKLLNEGTFPLVADDPLIDIYYQNALRQGNLHATCDPVAYQYANVVVVDINLDVNKQSDGKSELSGFDVDLTPFKAAMKTLGENCREDVLILVETTVPPGTCQKVVKPILDEEFKKRGLNPGKYKLGHSYERVMPGPQYIHSIQSYPRVYSGIDERSADAVESFLKTIIDTSQCELTRLGSTNATEMAKVLENSYRAMNISFVIEWTQFAEEAGVNLYEIVKAIRVRNTHANLMLPGIGVGGYCLTKDPLLASWSRTTMFNGAGMLDMSVKAVTQNDKMPVYAFRRLKFLVDGLSGKRVAILGVSYRGDVGDTRFSPVEPFVKQLESDGAATICHDPYVDEWPELNRTVQQDLAEVLSASPDMLVICAGHKLYSMDSTIDQINAVPQRLFIFDTIGLLSQQHVNKLATRHQVKVLGRGDI
ncbi:MAG: nucleotide sugar dehydrogenase [Chloroflexi bacterium]|nr:nucleotide sugar dehydrogenase [Chloroflexota bacterium]